MNKEKIKFPRALQKKFQNLAVLGNEFRTELARAELWETFQIMDKVLNKLGYEAADIMKRKMGVR